MGSGGLVAQGHDMKRVHHRKIGEAQCHLKGQLASSPGAHLGIGCVRQVAPWQGAGTISHGATPQHSYGHINAQSMQQPRVASAIQEPGESGEAETHLGMSEGCTTVKLASQQPQLSVGVGGKRVQYAAPCDWQWGQPFPGSGKQLRPGHVADPGNPGNVVAVEADNSVAAEGGSANHLALER